MLPRENNGGGSIMWDQANTWERAGMVILLIGSIVDIFQFTWIVKKAYRKFKEKIYKKVREEIFLENLPVKKEIYKNDDTPFN